MLKLPPKPLAATAKLNEKTVKAGKLKVAPGTYTLTASKDGFASRSITVTVGAKETKFIGAALVSNRDDTKDWYQKHLSDQLLLESITGGNSSQQAQNLLAENPILKMLPVLGLHQEYRIDAGASQKGNDEPALYIRSLTTQGQANAVQWIKDQGYDPGNYEIIYLNELPSLF
jgi:hypothetical protein